MWLIVHEGNAFSLLQELEEEERDYLTQKSKFGFIQIILFKKMYLVRGYFRRNVDPFLFGFEE